MESNYRYGLFVDGELIEDYPDTLEGFREAIRKSNTLKKDKEDFDHEVRAIEIDENGDKD